MLPCAWGGCGGFGAGLLGDRLFLDDGVLVFPLATRLGVILPLVCVALF